ncbi:MarR family winged helix-turn-helix transcriptional regulator [Herpetosiphon llansteffanensis]
MNEQQKPIGYWLKEADQAITACLDRAMAQFGLSRLAWQLLNIVQQQQPVRLDSVSTISAVLADHANLRTTLAALIEHHWLTIVTQQADVLACELTIDPAAQARFADVTRLVHQQRAQLMQQITPEAYQTTLNVLAQLIKNAEASNAA